MVRGYHPLLATVREPGQAGEVLHTRLRRGNAASGQGGGHFLTEALGRVRAAGASGPLLVRADAGFYARSVVRACRRTGARFSITVRTNPAITAAIAASRTPPGRRFRTGTRWRTTTGCWWPARRRWPRLPPPRSPAPVRIGALAS